MLQAITLSCLRGDRRLFSNLSVTVQPGTLLAVVGENGSGKTSLLRMLLGFLSPEDGAILWQGQDIREQREQYCAQLTYVGHLNGIKDDLTAMENLDLSASLAGDHCDGPVAHAALEAVGLRHQMHQLPTKVLSQGQKRRVALARLWLSTRPLWLLDEPFTSLDTAATGLVTEQLHKHLTRGGIAIVVTHQEVGLPSSLIQHLRING
ncbi:MAG: cytochrome c biogenesis heme-transporting ATPase CcmA [Nitrospira sp.]|nr:cytochrome c biogenesis heme-transporting ATPase CcmA [Nitrospira sp.]